MTPYENKCMHCDEKNEEKMYNEYICKKCRTEWEKKPFLK